MKKVTGVKYLVTEGDWTLADEHAMQSIIDLYTSNI